MKGLAYKRFQREKHIKRKEHILRLIRSDNPPHEYNDKDLFGYIIFPRGKTEHSQGYWLPYWIVKARGQLSKGKIHCSCGMCSSKTRNKNNSRRRISWDYKINYKHSDLQKKEHMDWDEKEFLNFGLLVLYEDEFY